MLKPSELLKNTLGLLNTPGNIITAIILFCGAVATVMRFGWGIGAVTNLDDYYPWGLWIGFDLLCGVALAAGGFTLAAGYYIFGFSNLRSMWRPALTTAFFGYAFVIADLLYVAAVHRGRVRVLLPLRHGRAVVCDSLRVAWLAKTARHAYEAGHAAGGAGHHTFHPAPVFAGRAVCDGSLKNAPPVVFIVAAGVFFCFKPLRRAQYGDF